MTYLVGLGRTGGVLQIALGFTGVTCMGEEQPAAAGQATPRQGRSVARGSPGASPALLFLLLSPPSPRSWSLFHFPGAAVGQLWAAPRHWQRVLCPRPACHTPNAQARGGCPARASSAIPDRHHLNSPAASATCISSSSIPPLS